MKPKSLTRRHLLRFSLPAYWLLFLVLFYAMPLSAAFLPPGQSQEMPVQGRVTGEEGEPLPGVSIRVQGSNASAVSGEQGDFSLEVPEDAVLVVSFLGYETREVPVDGRRQINIVLEPDVSSLEEVVVVGYGTMQKSDLTGAISIHKLAEQHENRIVNVSEALQGRMAGVNILNNTGEPGSGMTFNIRGTTSITGSRQPLIVIDGQPVESDLGSSTAGLSLNWMTEVPPSDPLAALNPSDIESVEVLKDASATAIYGSRGANGVVMITTKSGMAEKDQISYSFRSDINSLPQKIEMASSREFMNFINEALENDGQQARYTPDEIDSLSALYNTNWQDLVYRNAFSQEHQLSVSNRTDRSSYRVSANYTDQQSVINNAGFRRGGLRFNYNKELGDRLTLNLRSYVSLADRDYAQQSNGQGAMGSSAVMGAMAFNPIRIPYQEEDGELDESFSNNPVLVTTIVDDHTQIRTLVANLALEYRIVRGLTYKLKGGANDLYSLRQQYWPRGTFQGNSFDGSATRADHSNSNFLIDHILTFRRNFNKQHRVNAVGGFSYQQWNRKASSVTSTGFPTDALGYNNFASAQSPGPMRNLNRTRALASFLGRMNYTYRNKYNLTLTGRYDGATRLAKGRKWHLFPSIGLGWNVSNEPFFEPVNKTISLLKLRGSYGESGNENIGIGATQASYNINYAVFGQDIHPSYVVGRFDNPNLTWETTAQYNAGMDMGFVSDRILLTVDLYQKKTRDLLINLSLPGSATFTNYSTNLGEVVNKGIDVEGTFRILTGAFSWTMDANFSVLRNEINNLGAGDRIFGRNFINAGNLLLNQPLHVARVGGPVSAYWGYKTDGIYQNEEEVAAGPEASSARPGDVRFVDTDGDGQIGSGDQTVIGDPFPDFTYGFSSDFAYKKWTFSFTFLGSAGNQLINLNQWIIGSMNTNGNFNLTKDAYDNRWTGEGTSNKYPRPNTQSPRFGGRFPDYMIEDASFFRLQTVTLGYTFSLPPALKASSLRAFVSGTNLLTATDYSGYDPNVNAFGHASLLQGVDYGTLAQPRTFSAGVTVTF